MKKKCKMVMLPTNEKSNIILGVNLLTNIPGTFRSQNFNLYILSDEEIKEGEILPYLMKWENGYELFNSNNGIRKSKVDRAKRIIATTNKSLRLPEPSPEFIEVFIREYNKGNVIEEVMVEYDNDREYWESRGGWQSGGKFKVFQEPKPGEYSCIMDYYPVKLKVDKNNYITITKVKDSWSREEVIEFTKKLIDAQLTTRADKYRWIEQNL